MNNQTGQILSITSALLIGALIGAGVGMLTAPRSGEETRSLIRDKSMEMKDRAGGVITDTRDRAGRALDEFVMSTTERIPALKHKVEETTKKVESPA